MGANDDSRDQAQSTSSERTAPGESARAVALPSIATPKGGGAIRSIGETFRANPVTGTGSLSVPIPLSSSRAGGGPKLALSYDSGQGQGAFGIGWNVEVPSIARRTDKGLPQYRDAQDSDEFVLSGAEVLVPALAQSGGAWERDAFDVGGYHVERYRPRVESSFARIEKRTDRATGDVHWQTVTKDNTTSIFGKSAPARVSDPKSASHVFRWLLEATIDDCGNVSWFEYKAEDAANVPRDHAEERTRVADPASFTNRYVKRIHYGNRTILGSADPVAADLSSVSWLFEVVFDYGEHAPEAPTPDEAQPWLCRQDPFSSFRSTFDIRTYRLCRRILLFHAFEELGSAPVLVRSLDLAYEESAITTYLRSVTETGWQCADGGYVRASMPRLDLDYTRAELQTNVRALAPESEVHVPGGVDGSRYRWTDLDGEGIPGVLSQQAGALVYKRNDGEGRLARADVMRLKPSQIALGAAGQMLTSLDADGEMDLVLLGDSAHGFFEREENGWSALRLFHLAPRFDFADPNLRFIDLDGDGLADVLVAEDEVFVWSRSLGKDGFERPRVVRKASNEDVAPTFVFADATQSIFVADMTGDGLVDLVRVRDGEICYWPNLGYGRFGAKITMGAAPRFDDREAFDPKRLRFGDIDGSGTSDIAYVRSDGVALYLNQSGNRWSDPVPVSGVRARRDSTVDLVDLLGTGTSCLVWSSPQPADSGLAIRYVDLLASTKPHLLSLVRNNLGLETRIAYTSSTKYYLEDRAAGTPWVTRLPFPVQVLSRIETADGVQRTRLVTTYRYKHGYFDGLEREFRGFGRIDQWDAEVFSSAHGAGLLPPGLNEQDGEFALPPVHTITWLDTGAWREARDLYDQYRREWYALDPAAPALDDPSVPLALSTVEEREAVRARRGMLLRREVYAADGSTDAIHPYVVEEHRYAIRRLQPTAQERHAVFFAHEIEAIQRYYERDPSDPRVEHSFTIEVDDFGNVLRSARLAYPRRAPIEPEQEVLLATCIESSFANETSAFYRIGVAIESRAYELTGLALPPAGFFGLAAIDAATSAAAALAFDATPAPGSLEKRLLSQTRTLYLRDDLGGPLALGSVDSRGLVFESYTKTLTPSLVSSVFGARVSLADLTSEGGYVALDGDLWRPSGRPTYDPAAFYQATALTDPFGNTSRVVFDSYGLLVRESHSSDDPNFDNVVIATNDYRALRPATIRDPNDNDTALAFDALGFVVATALLGKGTGEGDTLADPTTRLEYDLLAWQESRGPASAHSYAREEHGAANPRWQETYTYSDGSGQEVLRKVQAEPGAGGAPRWVGTGRTVFDNKGNAVKKYEPYFSSAPAYEDEPSIVAQGVTPVLRYDALGRLVRTDLPDGTFETFELGAWTEIDADPNDNVLESAWYQRQQALPAGDPGRRAADLAAKHAHTPTRKSKDALGRVFLVVADNGAAGQFATRTSLDIQGSARVTRDARGNTALAQTFDMDRHLLQATSADAGERLTVTDISRNGIRSFDSRGFGIRTEYDRLRRPSRVYVTSPEGGEILAERIVYGEAVAAGAQASNLRGRKTIHYDGAGELHLEEYDFKGNLTTSTRRLALTYDGAPDWAPLAAIDDCAAVLSAAAPLRAAEPFTTITAYDALNRIIRITSPDASVVVPRYNEASLLERMDAGPRGVAAAPLVSNLDYDAKGRRVRVDYVNGIRTAYAYDPLTFLLTRQTTTRASDGKRLQDLAFTYDPAHNIVEIDDDADSSAFFSGSAPVAGGGLYEYDAVYRLTRATGREHPGQQMPDPSDSPLASLPHPNDAQALRAYVEQYDYDAVGNILRILHQAGGAGWTRHYQYAPDGNRLLRTSAPGDPDAGPYSAVYDHDASGNMKQMPHLAAVVWNHANRMVRADLGGGGVAYYAYDAAGQRVRKRIERVGTIVEERIYCGGYEVYRRSTGGSPDLERQTLHVLDGQKRVALVEMKTVDAGVSIAAPTPRFRYQLANHIDSSCIEVDDGGLLISYEEYFPFGASSFRAADASMDVSAKRYRYTGKERDEETGLGYHGARYCASWLGRWTSCDPAGIGADINLYAYVHDNPIRLLDPTGLDDDDAPPIGTSDRPGPRSYFLAPVPHYQLDPPNFLSSSAAQALGIMTPDTFDLEANVFGFASGGTGLGARTSAGGLQNGQLSYRRQIGAPGFDLGLSLGGSLSGQSADSGTSTTTSTGGGLGAQVTAHYGFKFNEKKSDAGLAFYGAAGVAGLYSSTSGWTATPTASLTAALAIDRGNPDPPFDLSKPPPSAYRLSLNSLSLSPTASYAETGQLSQGPTLHNPYALGATAGVGVNVGRNFVLTLEGTYSHASGSADNNQAASSDTLKAGIIGTYNWVEHTTSGPQTSSVAVGIWGSHESGSVTGPSSPGSPSGSFATDMFILGITLGYRRPTQSN